MYLYFSFESFKLLNKRKITSIRIKGRINKFWIQEFATGYTPEHCEADVEFDLALIDNHNKKTMWFDVKRIHKKSKVSMTDITELDQPTMNEALNEAIDSVLGDAAFSGSVNGYTGKGN